MKTPRIANALSQVDDDIISSAAHAKKIKKNKWLKWGSIAACFAIMLVVVVAVAPMVFNGDDPVLPSDEASAYVQGYFYGVDEGTFSTYVGGKVIANDKLGNKISDVSVTAGWKNDVGEWISEIEKLRGEVYTINGVSSDVAVALKFIDKGDAVTTTHYYVIMNPNADLTAVKDYIIAPHIPNNPSDELSGTVEE